MNDVINITSGKTWFTLKFSSNPSDGTVTYTCPEFFNTTAGSLTYSGDTVVGGEIYAERNTSTSTRRGTLSLTATTNYSPDYGGTASVTCAWTITQAESPVSPAIELSAPSYQIAASATSITFIVKSSLAYTVKYGDQIVFSADTGTDPTGDTKVLPISANTLSDSVEHVIEAFCTDYPEVSATTVFVQEGYYFFVSPTELTFDSGGGSNFIIITNFDGYSWEITGLPTWLTVSGLSSGNASAVTYLVAIANDGPARSATITVNETTSQSQRQTAITCSQASALSYNYTFYHYGLLGEQSSCYGAGYEVKEGDDEITFNNGFEWINCSLSGYHGTQDVREEDCTIVMRGGSHTAETYTSYSSAVSLNDGKIEFNGTTQSLPDCAGGGYGGAVWILGIRIYDHGYRGNSSYLKSEAYSTYAGSSSSGLDLRDQTTLSGTIEPGSYDVEIVLTRAQDSE